MREISTGSHWPGEVLVGETRETAAEQTTKAMHNYFHYLRGYIVGPSISLRYWLHSARTPGIKEAEGRGFPYLVNLEIANEVDEALTELEKYN